MYYNHHSKGPTHEVWKKAKVLAFSELLVASTRTPVTLLGPRAGGREEPATPGHIASVTCALLQFTLSRFPHVPIYQQAKKKKNKQTAGYACHRQLGPHGVHVFTGSSSVTFTISIF